MTTLFSANRKPQSRETPPISAGTKRRILHTSFKFGKLMALTVILLGYGLSSSVVGAAESGDTDTLPIEVQVDLYMAELTRLLEYDDHVGIVTLVPKIRALNIDIPDALFFIEARALYSTGDAIKARESLLVYLNQAGREGRYYDEATNLLLEVRAQAAAEEARLAALLQERERAKKEAANRAKALRIREVQTLLSQAGFPKTPVTGEMNGLTREALAVFQVRQSLRISGEITTETIRALKAAIPSELPCDQYAARPFAPDEFIPTLEIDYVNGVTACNEALRDYPAAARLHVQYARSLIAAGRPEDAKRAIADHVEIGYPSAMHVMAELHLEGGLGKDGDADYVTAEEWYLKAAERGDFLAKMDLYALYMKGASGVKRDYAAAIRWLTEASDDQHEPATLKLAGHYERGQGVSRDYEKAAELYQVVAEKDNVSAILSLADFYERGRGVSRDRKRALDLLKEARKLGDESLEKRIERLERRL
jgi:TPR repeat protein